MKRQLNIYFIEAELIWPVGKAGAIVIAATSLKAEQLVKDSSLYKPKPPVCIGKALQHEKERIFFVNDTDY